MSHFKKALETALADKPLMAAMRKMSARASCSAAVLPPDGVRGAMLALSAALEACKKADWTAAEGMTRMNALSLVDLIVGSIDREQNAEMKGQP